MGPDILIKTEVWDTNKHTIIQAKERGLTQLLPAQPPEGRSPASIAFSSVWHADLGCKFRVSRHVVFVVSLANYYIYS